MDKAERKEVISEHKRDAEERRRALNGRAPGRIGRFLTRRLGAFSMEGEERDPSRVIPSAEVGMTFGIEPESTLAGRIDKRLTQIKPRSIDQV